MDNFEDAQSLSHFSSPQDAVNYLRQQNQRKYNGPLQQDIARDLRHTQALLELNKFVTSDSNLGENLVFIVGLPRSGKSSLEHILSNDDNFINGGEIMTISTLFHTYDCPKLSKKVQYPQYLRHLLPDTLHKMGEQTIQALKFNEKEKRLIITTPSNYRYLPLLQKILPKAKIIWCKRNPKHHAINLFIKDFKHDYWNFTCHMPSIVAAIKAHNKFHTFCTKKMGAHFHTMIYDDFLKSPKKELKKIIKYLELDWAISDIQSHIDTSRNYLSIIESENSLLQNYVPYFEELKDL